MVRKLVIAAVVVGGLLGLADRGVASLAGSTVGASIQRSENLDEKPDVDFSGFPFLTQAFGGNYERIDIDVRDYPAGEVRIRRIQARLQGVHLSFGDAVSGDAKRIPVDHGEATVTIAYADVNEYLTKQTDGLSVVGGVAGQLRVRGTVRVGGQSVPVEGDAAVRVQGAGLRFVVTQVRSLGANVPASVLAGAASRLTFDLPATGLPFDIKLREVKVGAETLEITATAEKFVITPIARPGG